MTRRRISGKPGQCDPTWSNVVDMEKAIRKFFATGEFRKMPSLDLGRIFCIPPLAATTRSPCFNPSSGWAAALGSPCPDEGMPDKDKGASIGISEGNQQEESGMKHHPSAAPSRNTSVAGVQSTAIGVPSLPPLTESSHLSLRLQPHPLAHPSHPPRHHCQPNAWNC